jgi:hypothetical protein
MRLNATTAGAAAANPFFTLPILACISFVGSHGVSRIRFVQKSPVSIVNSAAALMRVLCPGFASSLLDPSAPNPAPAETNFARMQAPRQRSAKPQDKNQSQAP